ncbi:hypothetical protein K492DRAFT_204563 [Lichtheimia hyalospora FSU 10163]|nr:hypothetical protein K492DRAFT_204563 [Lichtheimia hyalospora FSU 10163]
MRVFNLLSPDTITQLDDDNDDFQPTQVPPSPNKRRRTSASTAEDPTDAQHALTCPVCMESMHNSGAHAVTSLKCGHLFCWQCLIDWFTRQMKTKDKAHCPQCKTVYRKQDMRRICTPNIAVYDTTELQRLRKQVDEEKRKANEAIKETTKLNMSTTLYRRHMADLNRRNEELKAENDELRAQLRSLGVVHEISNAAARSVTPFERFHHALLPCDMTGRIVALSGAEEMAIVSAGHGSGYGLQRISMRDLSAMDHFVNHEKQIRDIKISPYQRSIVLSTGHDRTLALSCVHNKHTMQRYTLEKPSWSCCYDVNDPNMIYCGLASNVVSIYDIRNTKSSIKDVQASNHNYGIHSMASVSTGEKKLLLCSNTVESYIWESATKEDAILHKIPEETDGFKPYSLDYQPDSHTLLISSRRGAHGTKHTLHKLNHDDDGISIDKLWSIDDQQPQPLMARTCHFQWGEELVTGFGTSNSVVVHDHLRKRQNLESDKPVLDVKVGCIGHETILAALTEAGLQLFK